MLLRGLAARFVPLRRSTPSIPRSPCRSVSRVRATRAARAAGSTRRCASVGLEPVWCAVNMSVIASFRVLGPLSLDDSMSRSRHRTSLQHEVQLQREERSRRRLKVCVDDVASQTGDRTSERISRIAARDCDCARLERKPTTVKSPPGQHRMQRTGCAGVQLRIDRDGVVAATIGAGVRQGSAQSRVEGRRQGGRRLRRRGRWRACRSLDAGRSRLSLRGGIA